MVLTDLVVFVGGIFESVKSPNFLWGEIIESPPQKNGAKDLKILKMTSKIHLYFRVLHIIIPLMVGPPPLF